MNSQGANSGAPNALHLLPCCWEEVAKFPVIGYVSRQKIQLPFVRLVECWLELDQDSCRVQQVAIVVRVVIVPGVPVIGLLIVQPVFRNNASPGLVVH